MILRLKYISQLALNEWRFVVGISVGFMVLYYSVLLSALLIKFQQMPNYHTWYDWPANVQRIVESTPSTRDTLMIIKNEWLLEIGFMNYDFGMGISEWSLFISPFKAAAVAILGAMLALLYLVTKGRVPFCQVPINRPALRTGGLFAGGMGATLVSLSLISLSWVVCCATPTWVVGLAILGLGVSAALWLEPIGIWLNVSGFILLAGSLFFLARSAEQQPIQPVITVERVKPTLTNSSRSFFAR